MASVADLQLEAEKKNETKLRSFNPTTKDVIFKHYTGEYTVHSLEIAEFPYEVGIMARKALLDAYVNEFGLIKGNYEATKEEALKKICV